MTKKDRADHEDVNNKTKAEIMEKIKLLDLDAIEIFEHDEIEVLVLLISFRYIYCSLYQSLRQRKFNPARFKKADLVAKYEVLNRAQQEYEVLLEIEKTLE